MIRLSNKLSVGLVFFAVSCSNQPVEELQGLWRSDPELTEINASRDANYVREELGEVYHYFDGNEIRVVYSSKVHDTELLKVFLDEKEVELEGDGFIETYRYEVMERGPQWYRLELGQNWADSDKLLDIHLLSGGDCYYVDNSRYGDYVNEYFCQIERDK